jgi:hypothetical protein
VGWGFCQILQLIWHFETYGAEIQTKNTNIQVSIIPESFVAENNIKFA